MTLISSSGPTDLWKQSRLEFARTLDRSLVHRAAISEVFVTDLREVEADCFLVGAQLPVGHGYFLDTTAPVLRYEAGLLAECARQASTAVAHSRIGVPRDWIFLMMSTSFRLLDDEPPQVGSAPAELTVQLDCTVNYRGGEVRGLRTRAELLLGARPVAELGGITRFVTHEEYEFLRFGLREVSRCSSAELPEPGGVPTAPATVGRRNPGNVFLADVVRSADGVRARLAVPPRHPTIFDHPLDHYPGMAIIEAASQAARLLAGPERSVLGFSAAFDSFVELDQPTELTARPDGADRCVVAVTQGALDRASVTIELAGADGRT